MINIDITDLQYLINHGIIDEACIHEQVEAMKRKELLELHPYEIYQGSDGNFYTYLPSDGKRKKS